MLNSETMVCGTINMDAYQMGRLSFSDQVVGQSLKFLSSEHVEVNIKYCILSTDFHTIQYSIRYNSIEYRNGFFYFTTTSVVATLKEQGMYKLFRDVLKLFHSLWCLFSLTREHEQASQGFSIQKWLNVCFTRF